jgi:hypothetical protein
LKDPSNGYKGFIQLIGEQNLYNHSPILFKAEWVNGYKDFVIKVIKKSFYFIFLSKNITLVETQFTD